ncbi:hypothetical protein [Simkania negevensis]|uniref:hypothetical protein n=1 Tax=Simkania negevensis TaxID=83561 RepID=UPI0002E16B7A|nr:hypothetical protein [Simkania negevensis]
MKNFRFLLLFCLPAFLLSPIPSYTFESKTYHHETGEKLFIPRDENGLINPWGYFSPRSILTYLDGYVDHVFGFIDLLTNVDFLESLCDEEAQRLIDFTIFIVRFSIPKSRPDLAEKYEQEIEELLDLLYEDVDDEEEYQLSSNHDLHWECLPAVCYEKPEFLLCKKKKDKGWFERKWHHFTHWVDKNKVPLIMGGATIGVLAIGYVLGGVGASVAAAAVGGGIVNALEEADTSPPYINKPGEVSFRGEPPEYISPPSHINKPGNVGFCDDGQHHLPTSLSNPNDPIFPHEGSQDSEQDLSMDLPEFGLDYEELLEEVERVKEEALEATLSEPSDDTAREIARDFAVERLHESLGSILAIIEEFKQEPELKAGEFITPTGPSKTVSKVGELASRALGLAAQSATAIGTAATTSSIIDGRSSIPMTVVNDNIGWKVGDPINNRTRSGNIPTWNTVRYRYWRNEALDVKNGVITRALERKCYEPTSENVKRMERGLAPQRLNKDTGLMESVELHHEPPQRIGGLFDVTPVTPDEHAGIDPSRKIGG